MFQSSAPENRFKPARSEGACETHATQETVAKRVLATGRACIIPRATFGTNGEVLDPRLATVFSHPPLADDESVYATVPHETDTAANAT